MPHARAEPTAGSAAASDEDDEAGSGSGSKLVAPADPAARATWLDSKLATAISGRPSLGKAKIGVAVWDLTAGKELFAHGGDLGLNLASNAKLLTTTAALSKLGGGFRWRTAVYADDLDDATGKVAGDLYIRGRGDPTLSQADLRALAADVAARGVRSVAGGLVVDASYFDAVVAPPHFTDQPNERAGYRAPVASLSVAHGAVTVVVTPEPGGAAKVTLEPDAGDYVKLTKAEIKTIATGRTKIKVDAKPKANHLEIEVTGQIRPADGSYDTRKRVDDPARFAGAGLRRALAERGVKIAKREIAVRAVPPAAKLIAAHDSAPLALAVREMNKQSDNNVAETVLKTLGAETRTAPGAGTWADGVAAVHAYLATIGMPDGGYRAENGSGLYGSSEVSARQVVQVLKAANADFRIGPDVLASLPVGGVDGTLAKRWAGHDVQGRVRAKTGTLDKVTSLAGYVAVSASHVIAFAIIVNDIPGGQRPASRSLADDIVDSLVAYLEADAARK